MNSYSQLSGLGDVIAIILKGLIGGLTYFTDAVIKLLNQTIGGWFLNIFYYIFCWVPINIINICILLFRFFASGFNIYLFGGAQNADGTLSYSFDPTSSYFRLTLIILAIGLMLFFINFLYGFSKNALVDVDGKPTMMQSRRFLQLKWPLIMVLLLLFTPIILTFFDNTMNMFMQAFTRETALEYSQSDQNAIKNFVIANDTGSYWRLVNKFPDVQLLSLPYFTAIDFMSTTADEMSTVILNIDNVAAADYVPVAAISNIAVQLEKIRHAGNNVATSFQSVQSSFIELKNIVAAAQVGQYLTNEQASALKTIANNVNNFQSYNYSYFVVCRNITTLSADFTRIDGYLNDYDYSMKSLQFNNLCSAYVASYNSYQLDKVGYYVGDYDNSLVSLIVNGQVASIGVKQFSTRSLQPITPGICNIMYQLQTGDPIADNWKNTNQSSTFMDNFSIFRFVLCILNSFSFIYIAFTFLKAAIDRLFYIIYAWMIGYLFLANGIKDSKTPTKWYKQIYGRWFNIIIFYVLFEAAGQISLLIHGQLYDSIARNPNMNGLINVGDNNIAPLMLTILTIQAAFQVAYQFSNTASNALWEVTSENNFANTMIRSHTFSAGLAAFKTASANMKAAVAKATDLALGGPITRTVKQIQEDREWRKQHIGSIDFGRVTNPDGTKGKFTVRFSRSNAFYSHSMQKRLLQDRKRDAMKTDAKRTGSIRSDGKGGYEYVISSKTKFYDADGSGSIGRAFHRTFAGHEKPIVKSVKFATLEEAQRFKVKQSYADTMMKDYEGFKNGGVASHNVLMAQQYAAAHNCSLDKAMEATIANNSEQVADNFMKMAKMNKGYEDLLNGGAGELDKDGKTKIDRFDLAVQNAATMTMDDDGKYKVKEMKDNTDIIKAMKADTEGRTNVEGVQGMSYEDQIKRLDQRKFDLLKEVDFAEVMTEHGFTTFEETEAYVRNNVDQQMAKERAEVDEVYADEKLAYEAKKANQYNDMSVVNNWTKGGRGNEFGTEEEIAANLGIMDAHDRQNAANQLPEGQTPATPAAEENHEIVDVEAQANALASMANYGNEAQDFFEEHEGQMSEINGEVDQASDELNQATDIWQNPNDGVQNADESLLNGQEDNFYNEFDQIEEETEEGPPDDADVPPDNGGHGHGSGGHGGGDGGE